MYLTVLSVSHTMWAGIKLSFLNLLLQILSFTVEEL